MNLNRLSLRIAALAERLSRIDPRRRGVRISEEFLENELAPVASSVDRFLERLDGFVEREHSFTAIASHELRTPLAVIQGATEILLEHAPGPGPLQNALTRIQRATAEMSEFIHALLMLSREDHADTEPGAKECDIGEITQRVIEDQRATLCARAVAIEFRCATPLKVQAPGSLATIVVGNLFRNAAAHTLQGSISCAIHARTLTITDTGTGIAPEHLEHVFNRTFTTRPGGHGIGLYLSKRICDRYAWKLKLESDPNGTTASIIF